MNKKIQDFTEQESLKQPLLITSVTKGVTNNGSPYLSITMQDSSGSIDGKVWDVKEDVVKICEPGKVYDITFETLKYRNSLQAKVYKIELIDQNSIDLQDYVMASKVPTGVLKQEINDNIGRIENKVIHSIVKTIFNEYEDRFFNYPAASKNHHNFVGGLATHVCGMLKLANNLCDLYPLLSRDLLIAGVLLHDVGKVDELSGPIMTEYTVEGKLLGHISIMQAKISEVANKLGFKGQEEVVLIRHMVLSHHGEYEYGSPVLPLIAEAEMLHYIDNIDARMNTLEKAFDTCNSGEFTPKIFAMENRNFYKHSI